MNPANYTALAAKLDIARDSALRAVKSDVGALLTLAFSVSRCRSAWRSRGAANSAIAQSDAPDRFRVMSDFKFSCPKCDQHLQCDERLGGRQIQCPACQHLITIPLSPAQQAQGKQTVESGNTWNTYIPRGPKSNDPQAPKQ